MPPMLIKLIVVLAVIGGAFVAGVKVESDHRDAQLLAQEKAFHAAYVTRATELRDNAEAISDRLNKEEAARRRDRYTFDQKLQEAKREGKLGQCEKPDVPGGAPVITINVGLWNAALTIGTTAGGDSRQADAGAAGTRFARLDDAYDNLGENSDRWKFCREQVRGWQELARKNGWVGSTSP